MTRTGLYKQIRTFCKDCMGGQGALIEGCTAGGCLMHDYRLPALRLPKKAEMLKTIRKYCLECTDTSIKEIDNCTSKECSLYQFRSGIDSKRGKSRGRPFPNVQNSTPHSYPRGPNTRDNA